MTFFRQPLRPDQKAAIINTVVLAIIGFLLATVIPPSMTIPFKLGAGFFLGTYAVFGKEVFKTLLALGRARRLDRIDSNRWSRPITLVVLALLVIAGIFSWMVGWEGSTGVPYGLGVFVGAVAFDYGIGKLLVTEYAIPPQG